MSPVEQLIARSIDAFNAGDMDAFAACVTEDVVIFPLRALMEDTVYRGSDAPHQFWSNAMEYWSELHVAVEEIDERDEYAVVVGKLSGRARTTGMDLDAQLAWLFAFRGGLISHVRTCRSKAEAVESAAALR